MRSTPQTPRPPAPSAATDPSVGAATRAGSAVRFALLLAGTTLVGLASAAAQTTDLPTGTPRPTTSRTTAEPPTARPAPTLRGSLAGTSRRGGADDDAPFVPATLADGSGNRLLAADPLTLEPETPTPAGKRPPASPSAGPATEQGVRLEPIAPGRAPREKAASGGPVEAVTRTGTVKSATPVPPLPATEPTPRDAHATEREEPAPEDDGYTRLGLRTGGFTWLPAVESATGWTSNVASRRGGASGMTWRVSPELLGRSDWSRHALDFELRGAYLGNAVDDAYDKPTYAAIIRGRIDLGDETRLDLKGTFGRDRESASSVDNPANTVVPATVTTETGSIGLTRDVGLVALTLRGDVERTDYTGGTTSSGTALGSEIQDNTRWVGALRAGWGTKGSLRPFVEVQASKRLYDEPLVSGSPRDATGAAVKVGVTADLGPMLRGEISTGWGTERPDRGTLPDVSGWLLDGSLVWSPTRLTTVKLDAKTGFEPTTVASATGSVSRTLGVTLEQSLRRDLVANAGIALTDKRYVGVSLRETDLTLSSGLTYKFDRDVHAFVKGSWERFDASSAGTTYSVATVMVGVRVQR